MARCSFVLVEIFFQKYVIFLMEALNSPCVYCRDCSQVRIIGKIFLLSNKYMLKIRSLYYMNS